MKTAVQVRQNSIRTGDTFSLLDLDGVFILAPKIAMVPKLACEIEQTRLEAGLSTAELLIALREERGRYYEETFNGEK